MENTNNTNNVGTVAVPVRRFEELLDLETRVNVAVEKIVRSGYIDTEDLLFILGTELAITKAEELHLEHEEYMKKIADEKQLGFSMMLEEENGEQN